jgi:hypothetical protein
MKKLQDMMNMELKIQQLENVRVRKPSPAPSPPATSGTFAAIMKMEKMQAKISALESQHQHRDDNVN